MIQRDGVKPYGKYDYNERIKAWIGVIAEDRPAPNACTVVLDVERKPTEQEIVDWIQNWKPST